MVAADVAAALKADPMLAEWRSYVQFNALNPARVKVDLTASVAGRT